MHRKLLVLVLGASILGGCATRGPLTIDCAKFRTNFVQDVPEPDILKVITDPRPGDGSKHRDGQIYTDREVAEYLGSAGGRQLLTNIQRTLMQQQNAALNIQVANNEGEARQQYQEPVVLLLSGGGQWGAYGAAYLNQMQKADSNGLPKFLIITGVSTGALQALYVAAEQAKPSSDPGKAQLAALQKQYSPKDEKEIVDRGSMIGAVLSGSVAGLGPLRKRIEDALCTVESGDLTCPLIDALAMEGAPDTLIGFVDANTGTMHFVNAKDIARDSSLSNKQKQQCITGAAMASVAMPFYFQQVRVASVDPKEPTTSNTPRTYYDGGVRQSVFFAFTDAVTKSLIRSAYPQSQENEKQPTPRTIFMMRNGPTLARADASSDTKADAITAATRGYQLLVNQSEVTSLAAIRPLFPEANIYLTTADYHDKPFTDPAPEGTESPNYPQGCRREGKQKEAMFDPNFMSCLRAYGRYKAKGGWLKLPDSKAQ